PAPTGGTALVLTSTEATPCRWLHFISIVGAMRRLLFPDDFIKRSLRGPEPPQPQLRARQPLGEVTYLACNRAFARIQSVVRYCQFPPDLVNLSHPVGVMGIGKEQVAGLPPTRLVQVHILSGYL